MKIEATLTPEEWAGREFSFEYWGHAHLHASGELSVRDDVNRPALLRGGELAKLISLANAGLPDDDPRKLTPQLLADARSALAEWHVDLSDDQWMSPATRQLARLLSIVESYLPPHG